MIRFHRGRRWDLGDSQQLDSLTIDAATLTYKQRCGLVHADALALTKLVNLLRRLPGLGRIRRVRVDSSADVVR